MSESLGLRMLYLVGEPDGAERVDVADLFAKRLAARGLDIDYVIFTTEGRGFWRAREWHGARAFVTSLPPREGFVGKVANKLLELGVDLRTAWQALTGSYDVVQVRDKFVVGVLALGAARVTGRKFTYWLSYPYAESRILDGEEGRSRFPLLSIAGGRVAAWLLYRIIMRYADHVFVQSRQMLEDVAAEGIPRERMTPVPMAVSEALLDAPPAPVEPGTVLYLGTLNRVRRLDVLVDAMALVHERHPEARLIVVGDGPDPEDQAFLERRAAESGLGDRVEFTGRMPMDAAHAMVARAAVCLSPFYPTPILQSTSPTKISEYMALGRPVVANTHPEQSVIIEESGAGICVEWSAEAFAEAINQLLDDPDGAEAMGALGRDYVRRHRIYPVIAPLVAREYAKLFDLPEGSADIAGQG